MRVLVDRDPRFALVDDYEQVLDLVFTARAEDRSARWLAAHLYVLADPNCVQSEDMRDAHEAARRRIDKALAP